MKSKTLVSSSIQWDFCSFLSRERNADGIHQPWHNAIFVNEMNSDNFCQWNQFQWIVNESMISMYLMVTTEAGALFFLILTPDMSKIKAPTPVHYVDFLQVGTILEDLDIFSVRVIQNGTNLYQQPVFNELFGNFDNETSFNGLSMNQWFDQWEEIKRETIINTILSY